MLTMSEHTATHTSQWRHGLSFPLLLMLRDLFLSQTQHMPCTHLSQQATLHGVRQKLTFLLTRHGVRQKLTFLLTSSMIRPILSLTGQRSVSSRQVTTSWSTSQSARQQMQTTMSRTTCPAHILSTSRSGSQGFKGYRKHLNKLLHHSRHHNVLWSLQAHILRA